ncbi:Cleavage stimulation factor subunit, partial [Thalictrum thalictroides]
VEQRRKEALSRSDEEGSSTLDTSLHDVVSRYSFMDLLPCSSKDLDHLARQEWLLKNINKKADKSSLPNGACSIGAEKGSSGLTTNFKSLGPSAKVVYPDTSRMVVYDPRQKQGPPPNTAAGLPSVSITGTPTHTVPSVNGGTTNPLPEILKLMPPALVEFITHLPAVEGPSPNLDIVLSILLQSNVPTGQTGQVAASQQLPVGPAGSAGDLSGSNKSRPIPNESSFKPSRESQSGKRKNFDRHEDDETGTVQNRPLPRDAFMIRQIRKARGVNSSQTGSASGGSMISGELSGSTGTG